MRTMPTMSRFKKPSLTFSANVKIAPMTSSKILPPKLT